MKLSVFYLTLLCLLMSCKLSETERSRATKKQQDMPEQVADSVEVVYSEEANIKMKLNAPTLIMKEGTSKQYYEFPDGLHMTFFKDTGEKNADLYANYGYDDQRNRERYVKDCVRIITAEGRRFTTDELYIDNKKDSVHNNNQYVKITEPNGDVLQGVGFSSDTRMQKIRINSIRDSKLSVEEYQQQQDSSTVAKPSR